MKKILLVLLIVLNFQTGFAQAKIDEYGALSYDDISVRLSNAFSVISRSPGQKAYFVIHKPKDLPFGTFLRYFYGVEFFWENWLKYPGDKIKIIAGEEREKIFTQIWSVSEGGALPDIKSISLENRLKEKIVKKTLFDRDCTQCDADPPIPLSIFDGNGLKFYAEALKANPKARALILLGRNYRIQAVRNKLTKDYGIKANRVKIQIRRSLRESYDAEFYIIPGTAAGKIGEVKNSD